MTSENRGYTLRISGQGTNTSVEKIYLKPMTLYVPDIAFKAVSELLAELDLSKDQKLPLTITVTNNNNGVSVDKDFAEANELCDPQNAADSVKDLINIVRGYESDEETNVCGW